MVEVSLGRTSIRRWRLPKNAFVDFAQRPVMARMPDVKQSFQQLSAHLSILALCCGLSGAVLRADDFETATKHYEAHEWQQSAAAWEKVVAESSETARAVEAQFYWAESLIGLKAYREAIDHLDEFIRLAPEHRLRRQAEFRIAECYYLQAAYDEAWEKFQEFAIAHPDDSLLEYVLPYMGLVRAKQGDRSAAKRLLVESLARFPTGAMSATARLRLAHLALAENDSDAVFSAHRQLETIDAQNASSDEWKLMLGFAYQQRAEHTQAIKMLQSVDVDRLTADRGATAVFALASSHRRLGQWADAAREFQRLVERWPDSAYRDRAELAWCDSLVRNDQAADGLARIEALLERLPSGMMRREVIRLQVQTLVALDKVDQAIRILDDLCQETAKQGESVAPGERARNWYQLAVTQLRAGQAGACLQALDRIRTDDLSADWKLRIDYLRGSALVRLEKWTDATRVLKDVMERSTGTPYAAKVRTRYLEALIGEGHGEQLRLALRNWRPEANESISCLQRIKDLADERRQQNDLETALAAFEALAQHNAESRFRIAGLAGLGWMHYDLGHWQEAIKAFEQLDTTDAESDLLRDALLARAFALEQLARHDESVRCYQEFLKRYPHETGSRQAVLGLALGFQHLQRFEDAARWLRAGLEEPEEPAGPSDVRLRYQLGLVFKSMRRSTLAAEEFRKIYEGPRETAYWSEATYRLAEIAFLNKEYQQAGELLSELHRSLQTATSDPLDASLAPHQIYLEGRVALELQHWNEALTLFDHMLVDFPDSPLVLSAQRWSAEALFRLEDYANARVRLETVLSAQASLSPTMVWQVRLRYAQVLAALKEWQAALELARHLRSPEETVAQAAERELLEARCLTAVQSWHEARAIYERLLLTELNESYRNLIQEQLQQLNDLEGERTGEQLPISTSVPQSEKADIP